MSEKAKRPQFAVNTKEMSATMPLLPEGEYAGEIYSAGINPKVPLTLQLETLFDDQTRKPYEGTEWVIAALFGFNFGVKLISEKAIEILGRDEPKFFPPRGIALRFHKYGTTTNQDGQEIDLSYTWDSSPVLKELLNVVGLGDVNYAELVDVEWSDDLEFLLDRLGFSHKAAEEFQKAMPDEQLLTAANALNYYREYFDLMAKDIQGKLVKVIIIQSKIPAYPSKMENNIFSGTFKTPSCGLVEYENGCEFDK